MAAFKCKMCGAALNVSSGMTVCECEYCGTAQTLPKLDNEKRNQLFDRANHYRMNKEFDKASVVYENILAEAPDEAEAHWGMCLCRYGIEYVVAPKTNKRIPTCHRTQFRSILEDGDYLGDYKDSPEQIKKCTARIEEINKERKKKKRITLISCTAICSITAALIAFVIVLNNVIIPNKNYNKAMDLYNSGNYEEAIEAFEDLNGYKDSKDKIITSLAEIRSSLPNGTLSAELYTVGLKTDGTVAAVGDNEYGQCNVSNWSDIVAVSTGSWYTVGLKSDGTVAAVGDNYDGQCDVSGWSGLKTKKE